MSVVFHQTLPDDMWALIGSGRLPGVRPVAADAFVAVDEAYGGQMALRDEILGSAADAVAYEEGSEPAQEELLDHVLGALALHPGFSVAADAVLRPDGVRVPVRHDQPMHTLGQLLPADFCILEKQEAEHVMTAAVLCFPASWSLHEKIGRPLVRIHRPVDEYDASVATRVQRLFDGVRVGQPIGRGNALFYDLAELRQPRVENDPRPWGVNPRYLRSERQTIFRLPKTDAVVFSIQTYVLDFSALTPEQHALLEARASKQGAG